MKLCELWLSEDHINALSFQSHKPILIEFYAGIRLVYLSIVQQKSHLLLVLLTSNHLLAGVHIGQLYSIPTHASKRIQDDLGTIALVCNVLGNLLRRVYGPGVLVDLDAFIELLEKDVTLIPVFIELELAILLLLDLLGLLLLVGDLLFQQG